MKTFKIYTKNYLSITTDDQLTSTTLNKSTVNLGIREKYKNITIDILSVKGSGVKPPSLDSIGTTEIQIYKFQDDNEVFFSLQLPYEYKFDTPVSCDIHWFPSTTSTGTATFTLEYIWTRNGGDVVSSSTTLTKSAQITTDNQYITQETFIEGIQLSGSRSHGVIMMRFNVGLSGLGPIFVTNIDFHYLADKLGADQH